MIKENIHKAKLIDNDSWVEGILLQSDDECRIITSYLTEKETEVISAVARLINPKTICQYIGKNDKSELPIFTNAIVKESTFNSVGVVKFGEHDTEIGYYIEWVSKPAKNYRKDLLFWLEEGIEVIGNIFDNSELLRTEV